MCRGDEPTRLVFACEPIGKTALELGIVTTIDIVHSADQPDIPAAIGGR
jgi:hypothetical protein